MEDQQGQTHAIKLITVHGTGAGDPENLEGKRWWQLGSKFHKELGDRINLSSAELEFEPFQWKVGPNKESERRNAGISLLKRLRDYDEQGIKYILIGHSHGGSVIYQALLHSVLKGQELSGLLHWTTIGTPFLNYTKNTFMFQRLTGIRLTIYTTGLAAFLISLTYWIFGTSGDFNHIEYANSLNLSPAKLRFAHQINMQNALYNLAAAFFFYSLICFVTLFVLERRKKKWFTTKQKKRVEDWYAEKWLGLWHQEDEAISALINVRNVSYRVVPSSFLAPIVGYLNFILVAFFALIFVVDIMFLGGDAFSEFAFETAAPTLEADENTGMFNAVSGEVHWFYLSLAIVALLLMVGVVIGLFTWVLKYVARVVGIPIAALFNSVIWKSVRDRAWGDDLPSEDVKGVANIPPEFSKSFPQLPDAVALPLKTHSDGHAISTLNKVRILLGMADDGQPPADLRAELTHTLNWQELIHTSYFEVPEFVDLVALEYTRRGLAKSKNGFYSPPAIRRELEGWLAGQP